MRFECEACGASYSLSDERVAGRRLKVRCRQCGAMVEVVGASSARSLEDEPTRQYSAAQLEVITEALKRAAPESSDEAVADQRWHAVIGGEQVGPIDRAYLREQVRQGRVTGRTYVWSAEIDRWAPITEVAALADLLEEQVAAEALPPPPAGRPRPAKGAAGGEEATEALSAAEIQAQLAAARDPFSQVGGVAVPPPPEESTAGVVAALGAQRARARRMWWMAGALVAALVGGGAYLAVEHGGALASPPPPPAGDERASPVVPAAPSDEREGSPGPAAAAEDDPGIAALMAGAQPSPRPGPKGRRRRTNDAAPVEGEATAAQAGGAKAAPTAPPVGLSALYGSRGEVSVAAKGEMRERAALPGAQESELDGAAVAKRFADSAKAFESCVQQEIRRNPSFPGGKVRLVVTVAPTGRVEGARLDDAALSEAEVGVCIRRVAKRMLFPSFAGSEPVAVDAPLVLARGF